MGPPKKKKKVNLTGPKQKRKPSVPNWGNMINASTGMLYDDMYQMDPPPKKKRKLKQVKHESSDDDDFNLLLDSPTEMSYGNDEALQPRKKPKLKQTQDSSDSEDSVTNGSLRSRCLKKVELSQNTTKSKPTLKPKTNLKPKTKTKNSLKPKTKKKSKKSLGSKTVLESFLNSYKK